jgi:hypothetical protein
MMAAFFAFKGITMADEKPATSYDMNTMLMETTFRIQGPKKGTPNAISFGTGFLVGKPTSDNSKAFYVLITAAHVLDGIDGDDATLMLREKQRDGNYLEKPWNVKIRNANVALYVKHNEVDAAAIYLSMPDKLDITMLPMGLLSDDKMLHDFEIHPGDQLFCLGFPLFVSSESGFPILRSGTIASYPLIPTKIHKNILFDFRIYEGNSGGPVYFIDRGRTYKGNTHLGETIQFIVGLVTSQLGSKAYNGQMIQMAAVVPSSFILETIALLPPESPYK